MATSPPSEPDVSDNPTNPPKANPDATIGVSPSGEDHDSSLTDFLAPAQAPGRAGAAW